MVAMIFINLMMLKIELGKQGIRFIHNKYTEYKSVEEVPYEDDDLSDEDDKNEPEKAEEEEEKPVLVEKNEETGKWNAAIIENE